MLKSCFFKNILVWLVQCGFGRGKHLIICGKDESKQFQEITLAILIYDESIKTQSRKRRMIQLFSMVFLKISSSLGKRSVTGPKGCFEFG